MLVNQRCASYEMVSFLEKKNCVVGEMKPVKLVFTLPHLYCLSIFSRVEVISLAQKRSVLRAPYCHLGTTNWNL